MNNKLKKYQIKKLKQYLKKTNLIFFFFSTNLNSANQLKLDQKLFKYNLTIYKTKNALLKHVLNQSIFANFSINVKGPLCIIKHKKTMKNEDNLQKLVKFNLESPFLNLKLNNKFYSNSQLKNLPTLNYKHNITNLTKTFNKLLKTSYYKIKKL